MTSSATVLQRVSAVVALTIVVAATPALRGQGGTAKGTVMVDAEKVALMTATAVGFKGANGLMTAVLLSDKPPDAKSFAEDTKVGAGEPYVPGIFSGAWKSQHFTKRFSGFTFTFTDAGKIVDEEILMGGKNKTFSLGSDEYVLELTSKGPKVAGRIHTKTPVVDVGKKVGLDVTFDAPVTMLGK
jgi:hypothetical protein